MARRESRSLEGADGGANDGAGPGERGADLDLGGPVRGDGGLYRDRLSLPVRSDRPGHLAVEWPNGMRLTLGVHQRVSGPAIDADRVMVNFAVTDIHAVAQELRAAGVTFSREPTQESWGGWIATFADPDGNTLQLLQPVG